MLDLNSRPGHTTTIIATAAPAPLVSVQSGPTLAEPHAHVAGRTDLSPSVRSRYLGAIDEAGRIINRPLAGITAELALVEERFSLDGFDPSHWSTDAPSRRPCGSFDDLRVVFDRLLPGGAPVRETVRDAIRAKRPRGRSCDRRGREALRDDPLMAPYRDLSAFSDVPLEDLRALARFLAFAAARGVGAPTQADYLAFTADTGSSRRLRSLKSALGRLPPGEPARHAADA